MESLFQLYVDIERTSRNNAFYEKFNARYRIGEVLGAPLACMTDAQNVALEMITGLRLCMVISMYKA